VSTSSGLPRWTEDDPLLADIRRDGWARVKVGRPVGLQVVLGRAGAPEREVRLDHVRADGVPLLRRDGGGGAVVLDPGNVVVSLVARVRGLGGIPDLYRRLSGWLAESLARLGVPGVSMRGVCDLVLGERKIGGACLSRSRDLVHYTTTLLVEPDVGAMERYLLHPPREPDYRQGRSHREFVGSLHALAGVPDAGWLAAELGRSLSPAIRLSA
jgi:lipoate---protein ligase